MISEAEAGGPVTNRVFFFDVLRFVAAIAVVSIHVLGPYRELIGRIPQTEWVSAVGLNSTVRWAVPVFIMISGALMLSDPRPFEPVSFFRRRFAKVLVPFVAWSVFYAGLSGLTASGFNPDTVLTVLSHAPFEETYYHLGFFYYFLPLYFVIPLLRWLVSNYDSNTVLMWLGVWLTTTGLFLSDIDGPWSMDLWLYSGYLLLGWWLYQKTELVPATVTLFVLAGVGAVAVTAWMVLGESLTLQEYTTGRWLSYKTLNTVVIAASVFVAARYWGEGISAKWSGKISFVSRYSLGIYLLHPIFLWPVIELEWYRLLPAWLSVPVWTLLAGGAALMLSYALSRSRLTAWLTP